MPPLARYAWRIALFALAIAGTALAFPELCQRRLPTAEPEAQALGESPRPPTPPPPRPAVQPRPRDAGAPAKVADEHGLLLQIRAALASDPARAEALARESRRRYLEGAEADERDALLVDALVHQQRMGAARDETYYYFAHHPRGRFADHLFTMTGIHPSSRRTER